MAALFDCLKRINTIISDLDRDFWTYVSMDYQIKNKKVKLVVVPCHIKSSMILKTVGNLVLPMVFEHLAAKLPYPDYKEI